MKIDLLDQLIDMHGEIKKDGKLFIDWEKVGECDLFNKTAKQCQQRYFNQLYKKHTGNEHFMKGIRI